jgi:3'-phosphoadenosine 5'-phosphosulfate sulfotransferase (PAPS reductase)/FAD synthetase
MKQLKFSLNQRTFIHVPTDREIIVPVSGGKDSTATLILALQNFDKKKIIPLHCNTGWDNPKTYEYLEYMEKLSGIKIHHTFFKEAPSMPDLVRRAGKFPNRRMRFCTARYKERATGRWYNENGFSEDRKGQVWLGIRSDESWQRRKKYGQLDSADIHDYREIFSWVPKKTNRNINVRFPIIDWSTEDCFQHIKNYGWSHNPLYDEGSNRVGCYPCLLSSKKNTSQRV